MNKPNIMIQLEHAPAIAWPSSGADWAARACTSVTCQPSHFNFLPPHQDYVKQNSEKGYFLVVCVQLPKRRGRGAVLHVRQKSFTVVSEAVHLLALPLSLLAAVAVFVVALALCTAAVLAVAVTVLAVPVTVLAVPVTVLVVAVTVLAVDIAALFPVSSVGTVLGVPGRL